MWEQKFTDGNAITHTRDAWRISWMFSFDSQTMIEWVTTPTNSDFNFMENDYLFYIIDEAIKQITYTSRWCCLSHIASLVNSWNHHFGISVACEICMDYSNMLFNGIHKYFNDSPLSFLGAISFIMWILLLLWIYLLWNFPSSSLLLFKFLSLLLSLVSRLCAMIEKF